MNQGLCWVSQASRDLISLACLSCFRKESPPLTSSYLSSGTQSFSSFISTYLIPSVPEPISAFASWTGETNVKLKAKPRQDLQGGLEPGHTPVPSALYLNLFTPKHRKSLIPHLSDPFLDEPKRAASALHCVLSLLQSHGALPKVPSHVIDLPFHSVGSASEQRKRKGREDG